VLPWRATVDYSVLTYLGLQSIELFISALTHRSINKSDLIGLQFSMKQFEQITPANCVDQHRGIFNWPPLEFNAIAMGTDVNANHTRTKRLEQHLGVGSVVAQIGDNESVGIIAAIKPSAQRSSALGSSSSTRTAVARVCDCAIVSGQNIPNSRAHKRL